ncbi:MAG: UDP-glucose/GDP-mannose dehydrogenase family protein, partial [Rhodospirillaceae bacterium]|nr:UDP-glucose/GDP-mannose dehydrogenase family protein [Rhodospirillaceae bacterium]
GIGSDPRIGYQFIYPGAGYGGSCFPKDVRALSRTASQNGYGAQLLEAVDEVNDRQKQRLFEKISHHFGGDLKGKTIALWGLSFKPNTDDMRDSPSLDIVPALIKGGATVAAYDPEGMDEAKSMLEGVQWCDDAYATMNGADALVIITEWNAFRGLDLVRVKATMKAPVMVDLRNIYEPGEMAEAGFDYYCVGRPRVSPKGT